MKQFLSPESTFQKSLIVCPDYMFLLQVLNYFETLYMRSLFLSQYIRDQHNFLRPGLLKTAISLPHFSLLKCTACFNQSSPSTKLSLLTEENYCHT